MLRAVYSIISGVTTDQPTANFYRNIARSIFAAIWLFPRTGNPSY